MEHHRNLLHRSFENNKISWGKIKENFLSRVRDSFAVYIYIYIYIYIYFFLRLWMEYNPVESNNLQTWTQRPWKHIIALPSACFHDCFNFYHFFEVRNEMRPNRVEPIPDSDSVTPKTHRNVYLVWWTRPFFSCDHVIEVSAHDANSNGRKWIKLTIQLLGTWWLIDCLTNHQWWA